MNVEEIQRFEDVLIGHLYGGDYCELQKWLESLALKGNLPLSMYLRK
jgi:hypothetical protein